MSCTTLFLQAWKESRTRFTNQFETITEADLRKKLPGTANTAGFLIRHIAEVELLFAKNVFRKSSLQVHAKTVISKSDSGEWIVLSDLYNYQRMAEDELYEILEAQKEEDWDSIVITKEFGSKSKAEALGRIVSHTAWHAGQLALILKYGNPG